MPQASLVFVSWPAPEIRSTPSRSLSPGPVSPETDLCGESSRHHMLVLCPYELYLLEQLGLWHHVWRTQQNKDLTTTRCSTVLPDHPLCFVLDLPQIAVLPVEGGGDDCLFVSKGTKASPCFNLGCQLMPWRRLTNRPFFFIFLPFLQKICVISELFMSDN